MGEKERMGERKRKRMGKRENFWLGRGGEEGGEEERRGRERRMEGEIEKGKKEFWDEVGAEKCDSSLDIGLYRYQIYFRSDTE